VIVGRVTAEREATIELTVYDKHGREHTIRAVVDTGYDGWLTLTEAVTAHLGLPWRRRGRGWLADGSETVFDIHDGRIDWDGETLNIPIDVTNSCPLVGMSLLEGFEFNMQVCTGGEVHITRLS
jgi:clan AA aspartic protease